MDLPVDYNKLTTIQRRDVRIKYINLQGGVCHHCMESLTGKPSKDIRCKPINERLFPVGFFAHPIHLHHDHKTGLTIGAVHALCNAVLWQYHGE